MASWRRTLSKIGLSVSCLTMAAMIQNPDIAFGQGEDTANVITLETVTVEAARPDWESILSPGTVNVIVPDDYSGEQKKLPEFLEMVPGLHINRRGGDGQYSTLTVRGSTSAQVNLYVDGVPQNTGADGTVDLSLIPVENVARRFIAVIAPAIKYVHPRFRQSPKSLDFVGRERTYFAAGSICPGSILRRAFGWRHQYRHQKAGRFWRESRRGYQQL